MKLLLILCFIICECESLYAANEPIKLPPKTLDLCNSVITNPVIQEWKAKNCK